MGVNFGHFTEINVNQRAFDFNDDFGPLGGVSLSPPEIPLETDPLLEHPEFPLDVRDAQGVEFLAQGADNFGDFGNGFGEGPQDLNFSLDQGVLDEFDHPGTGFLPENNPPSASDTDSSSVSSLLVSQPRRVKRVKIDKRTMISTSVYKERTSNSKDLVRQINLAPSSRIEVIREENQNRLASDVLNNPLLDLPQPLAALFRRNMVSKPSGDPSDLLNMEEEISPERAREEDSHRESFGELGGGFDHFDNQPEFHQGFDYEIPDSQALPHSQAISDFEHSSDKEPVEMTATTKNVLNNLLVARDPETHHVSFFDKIQDQPRVRGAKYFVELLNLRTRGFIDLQQSAPYSDIAITVHDP